MAKNNKLAWLFRPKFVIISMFLVFGLKLLITPFDWKESNDNSSEYPLIIVITPTYTRPTQLADMTRMAQTLMHVHNILWIVVEDSQYISIAVSELLNRTDIPYVQLLAARPNDHKNVFRDGRGVSNRLKALEWIRKTFNETKQRGVIYFADDDNSYDIRVFEEMRFTQKVSVFPVGLIGGTGLSAPILDNKTAKVIGFHDPCNGRKFAVDMAGFAISLQLFLNRPNASMIYKAGLIEEYFLKSLNIEITDLEPKANNCTEILVWHTKTTPPKTHPSMSQMKKVENFNQTNIVILYNNLNKSLSHS